MMRNQTKLIDLCVEIAVLADADIDPYEILFRLAWLRATEQWLRSPASDGWPGGDVNFLLMLAKIEMLGLSDVAPEKMCTALTTAFSALRAENALRPVGYID
jgi:hypothetical protein